MEANSSNSTWSSLSLKDQKKYEENNTAAFDDEILVLESIFIEDLCKFETFPIISSSYAMSNINESDKFFTEFFCNPNNSSTVKLHYPVIFDNDTLVYSISIFPKTDKLVTFIINDTEQDNNDIQVLRNHTSEIKSDIRQMPTTSNIRLRTFNFASLPLIILSWSRTNSYPSHTIPKFSISVVWLPEECGQLLYKKLCSIYEANNANVCIFEWIEWLKMESISYLLSSPSSNTSILRITDANNLISIPLPDTNRLHPLSTPTKQNSPTSLPCIILGGTKDWRPSIFVSNDTSQPLYPRSMLDIFQKLWLTYYNNTYPSIHSHHIFDSYINSLIDWNAKYEEYLWNTSMQACRVCFNEKLGKECKRLMICTHIYCQDCISQYIDAKIDAGDIMNIVCLDPECNQSIAQKDIRDILMTFKTSSSSITSNTSTTETSDRYTRYESLLLQRALDNMSDITYCPLPTCGKPAFIEDAGMVDTADWFGSSNRHKLRKAIANNALSPSSQSTAEESSNRHTLTFIRNDNTLSTQESSSSNTNLASPTSSSSPSMSNLLQRKLGRCSYCSYVFCENCKKPWHGLKIPCNDLITKFMNADEEGKEELRKQYGTGVFMELESQIWLNENSKPCLQCGTRIQKNRGCNHMTCRVCKFEWCWICGGPYVRGHFQSGKCEQFDDDYFEELNMTRAQFYHYFG